MLESFKQRRARVESEQAPTVEEGVSDWQEAEECSCSCCDRNARRNAALRSKVASGRRESVGEQV